MALIKCPGCGEEVSDKAVSCVHCGYALVDENAEEKLAPRLCPDCGKEVDAEAVSCPACGCPLESSAAESEEEVTKVEVAKVKVSAKAKKIAIGVGAGILALILVAFGVNAAVQNQKEQDAVNTYNEYVDNLTLARTEMLTGAASAESVASTAGKIWHAAIWEKNNRIGMPISSSITLRISMMPLRNITRIVQCKAKCRRLSPIKATSKTSCQSSRIRRMN